MKRFAFISRHEPNADQIALAEWQDIELIHVGDRNGFTVDPAEFAGFDGVVVVHAAAALRLVQTGLSVGVFENSNRNSLPGKPPYEAAALHVYQPWVDAYRDGYLDGMWGNNPRVDLHPAK